MYTLACKDMGMMDCPFVAEGETMEEAMMMSKDHAMQVHGDKMKAMMASMSEAEMMDMMKQAVKMM